MKTPFDTNRFRTSTRLAFAATALAGALVLGARTALSQTPPATPAPSEIRFTLQVGKGPGHVICALFRKEGWLKTPLQWKKSDIRANAAECVFTGVAPDVYAMSAFHDENDNGKLDTGLFGIPTENWCTSRDAKGMFGPPSFDDAKFRHTGGVLRQRASLE